MGWMVRPRLRPGAQRSEGRTVETLKMKQQEQQAWLFVAEHMLVTEEESRPGAGQGGGSQNAVGAGAAGYREKFRVRPSIIPTGGFANEEAQKQAQHPS